MDTDVLDIWSKGGNFLIIRPTLLSIIFNKLGRLIRSILYSPFTWMTLSAALILGTTHLVNTSNGQALSILQKAAMNFV